MTGFLLLKVLSYRNQKILCGELEHVSLKSLPVTSPRVSQSSD